MTNEKGASKLTSILFQLKTQNAFCRLREPGLELDGLGERPVRGADGEAHRRGGDGLPAPAAEHRDPRDQHPDQPAGAAGHPAVRGGGPQAAPRRLHRPRPGHQLPQCAALGRHALDTRDQKGIGICSLEGTGKKY